MKNNKPMSDKSGNAFGNELKSSQFSKDNKFKRTKQHDRVPALPISELDGLSPQARAQAHRVDVTVPVATHKRYGMTPAERTRLTAKENGFATR
jgi:hypothetical protein